MEIDRCFKKVVEKIREIVPEKDLREQLMDIYRKDIEKGKLYRLITGFGDAAKQEVHVYDAIIKFTREDRKMDFEFQSGEVIDALAINEAPETICPTFATDFAQGSTLMEFKTKTPIMERFFLVKENGKPGIKQLTPEKKLEQIVLPNF